MKHQQVPLAQRRRLRGHYRALETIMRGILARSSDDPQLRAGCRKAIRTCQRRQTAYAAPREART